MSDANIWTSPEKHRLTIVGSLNAGAAYEFDMFVVWRKRDGSVWFATDSGCSCPIPFEKTAVKDLQPLTEYDLQSWADEHRGKNLKRMAVAELLRDAFPRRTTWSRRKRL